ncbi:RiPP maturation radical SAM C-methyltransferase [Acrocarpospora macrocephala]|uniref:RiPP maturation radical SAM protein 1 n=2 Tax=Acrocarpospora macrocephala TaxID=150177 RepID=A0A5M3WZR4_9ACTN|nr:RiPP maturation radical SAM protein 1 [Acrocarpospora macrocephala]
MPWQALDYPSLPLGLLRAVCKKSGRDYPDTYYGNLRWAEFLAVHATESFSLEDYSHISDQWAFEGIGDWVFAGALHGDDDFGREGFDDYLRSIKGDPGKAHAMREYAARFIDLAAIEILATDPQIVGFTSTFSQNVPSLALAARIKHYRPDVITLLGGGNCDGVMGQAMHRNYFNVIDYIVRGEGEQVFPQLLDAIEGHREFDTIPGLCWAKGSDLMVNEQSRRPLPANGIPTPDYDDWFQRVEHSPLRAHLTPKLLLETSRGCWWGQVHHCTFCGLNGSLMEFRGKHPDRAFEEITGLVERHGVLDILMVDNIIDHGYFTTVLPRLAELDWDMRIHYEVKANLRPEQISILRDAKVIQIQPGIESLSTPVLKLMDKGVLAIHNLRTLRDSESADISVTWHWLVGFPGEQDDHYLPIIRQIPALVHLQPPGGSTRIFLERFSPYFDRPSLGFEQRRARGYYKHIYNLPEEELDDIAYAFDTEPAGIDEGVSSMLREALEAWITHYPESSLTRLIDAAGLHIEDRRAGWPSKDHHITDPNLITAYRELERGRSLQGLRRHLQEAGTNISFGQLDAWLQELTDLGLVFVENDTYITLPTTSIPTKVR